MREWRLSLGGTAAAVTASLWLWFGPQKWAVIPWMVAAGLPFLVGLFCPKIPLVFGVFVALLPYLIEGDVEAPSLLTGIGASYIAAGVGILIRRLVLLWRGGKTE